VEQPELVEKSTAPPAKPDQPTNTADTAQATDAERPNSGIRLEDVEKKPAAPATPADASVTSAAGRAATETDEPQPAQPPEKQPAADEPSGAVAVRRLSAEEIDERLGGMLPNVKFVKVSLAQFVTFIGDFAGIAISIDDDALATLGKQRQSPVTVKLTDTTAAEALRAAITPLGLTSVARGGRLLVTSPESAAAVSK
jgi:hypothetical protein